MTPTLYLTESDLKPLLEMGDAIACLEQGFARWRQEDVINLARRRAFAPQGTMMMMGAVDGPSGVYGFKTYFPNKLGVGAGFHIALHSFTEGRLLALMQAQTMSQVRTGAASGLATKLMAREDASVLGIIGTGKQAFAQAAAVVQVRPIKQILVFGRDEGRRQAFAQRIEAELHVPTRGVESARLAIEPADVVVTVTSAASPVLDRTWLKPGVHINAAGANNTSRSEIDEATILAAALLATDDREQSQIEAGEFATLAGKGAFDWSRIVELGDLVTGAVPGRTNDSDITVFKSLGIAFEDVLYAERLYGKAVEAGIGQKLG